jgi:hypothetical protein
MAWVPPPVGGTRVEQKTLPPAPRFDLHGKNVLVTGGAGFVGHNFIKTSFVVSYKYSAVYVFAYRFLFDFLLYIDVSLGK